MIRALQTLAHGVLVAVLATSMMWAQAGSTAQISGSVRDESGAALPGADVVATQTDTGLKRSTVTDGQGNYLLPNLPIGRYRLDVTLQGFRTYTQSGVVLQVGAAPVLPVTLQIGSLEESVTVQGASPLVETRSPGIGQVIDNERIVELPLNGRNATDLIVLAGAAVQAGGASSRSFQGTQGGRAIAVGGGQSYGVAYVLDGATHNNPYDNLNLPMPFPDALQEFRVATSALEAQHGFHSGASVNAVTRSGTNQFHGNVFEFFRNHRLNATDPFAARGPDGRRQSDGLNRNQFGGTLGGPVLRDRLFFFGGYQGTTDRQRPADNTAFVPTAAMLAGDFSTIASPACNAGRQITLRAPFVNNRVDPALFSRAALSIASRLPTTTDPCGRIVYQRTTKTDEGQYVGRVDFNLSANHSLFGRYLATSYLSPPPFSLSDNILTSTIGGRDNLAQSATVGETFIINSRTVNSARVAFNRTAIHRTHQDYFSAPDLGINTYSYLPSYMQVVVTGGFNIGGGTESEARFTTSTYQLADDLTMVRGNHELGFGANLAKWNTFSIAHVRSPGTFTFDGSGTGLGLADFLTGNLTSLIQSAPSTLDMHQWYFGAYAQDTWRLSNRVTLSYGVRWDPYLPQQHHNRAVYNFDYDRFRQGIKSTVFTRAPAGFTYPGDPGFPNGNAGMDKRWGNVAPRAGIAWDPSGDGRMSVRAAYGKAYEFVNGQFQINPANAPPWGSEVRINNPVGRFEDPYRNQPGGNPFPVTFDASAPFTTFGPFIATPPDLDSTYVHSWNVSVQRQFGADWLVSASYVGNQTENLWNSYAFNYGQLTPGVTSLTQAQANAALNQRRRLFLENPVEGQGIGFLDIIDDTGSQTYNGLVLSAQRRATDGISLSGNYTLSKCEGDPNQGGSSPLVGGGYTNPDDRRSDYGNCDTDRRHIFNLTVGAQTPEFGNPFVNAIAADWRASAIFRASTGRYLSVTTGLDRALTGQSNQRVNQVLDNPYGDKTTRNYLNSAAFAQPALGTYGNLRRNSILGPGARVVDLAVVRTFRLGTHRIDGRIEAFNLFNWTRWNNPTTNFNSNTFGQILGAAEPRILQLAVKYAF